MFVFFNFFILCYRVFAKGESFEFIVANLKPDFKPHYSEIIFFENLFLIQNG